MRDLGRRRGEGGVDDRDLAGVDGELAGEAFATRRRAPRSSSPCVVLEVGEHAVDRLDPGGDRAGQRQRARQLVGEGEFAVGVIFGRGAERGGQVFGAPAHRGQRRLGVAVAEQAEQAGRGLGDDGVDRDVAGAVGDLGDVGAALGLGQDDPEHVGRGEQFEVGLEMLAAERVDPHPPARPAVARRQRL